MSPAPDGTGPGREDVDARFRSIIDAEFGPGPGEPRTRPRTGPPGAPGRGTADVGRPPRHPPDGTPFDLTRALDEAGPDEPAEPFVAPGAQPVPMPRGRALVGAVLLVGSLVVVLAGIFGMTLPRLVGTAAAVGCVAGLGILLSCLPRAPRDPDDDGARV